MSEKLWYHHHGQVHSLIFGFCTVLDFSNKSLNLIVYDFECNFLPFWGRACGFYRTVLLQVLKGVKGMFPFVISSLLRVLSFKRICPMCKKGQIVSSDQKRKPVKCKFCGATMPAPSANWRPHTQPDLIPWTAQWPPSYLFNEATRDRRHGAVFLFSAEGEYGYENDWRSDSACAVYRCARICWYLKDSSSSNHCLMLMPKITFLNYIVEVNNSLHQKYLAWAKTTRLGC